MRLRKFHFLLIVSILGLPLSANAQTTLHILGDSFASNFDNTVAPFDWPTLLDQQNEFSVELNASPGQRLISSHAPVVANTFPQSQADVLVIASGLNDFLTNFAEAAPGAAFNEPIFDQYFETGDQFTSQNTFNILGISVQRIVDQWRQDRPDRPVVIFNIPPFEQFLIDQGGGGPLGTLNSIRVERAVAYNQWLQEYVDANDDLTLFDIRGFLEGQGDYFAEQLPTPRLHPNAETQPILAAEIAQLASATVAVPIPEPSATLFVIALLQMAAIRRVRH